MVSKSSLQTKFKVAANGTLLNEEDVLSRVPHGTALASVLFLIVISDKDKEV